LAGRPHTPLWLAMTYVIPAGCMVVRYGVLCVGNCRKFSSPLSVLPLQLLKGVLV